MNRSWYILRYYHNSYLEAVRKTTKIVGKGSWWSDGELKHVPFDNEFVI
jgi:hypothetical protein